MLMMLAYGARACPVRNLYQRLKAPDKPSNTVLSMVSLQASHVLVYMHFFATEKPLFSVLENGAQSQHRSPRSAGNRV